MEQPERLRLGPHLIDLSERRLYREGVEVHVRPKTFDLLAQLARSGGRFHTYDELQAAVWPGVHVSRNSIAQCFSDVQRALGRGVIQTLHGRGVRLCVPVEDVARWVTQRDVPARARVAVVPFEHRSGTSVSSTLCAGLMDDLVAELCKHWSVYEFAASHRFEPFFRGAGELHTHSQVDFVVMGSVQGDAGELVVRARVVDARSGSVFGTTRLHSAAIRRNLPGLLCYPGLLLALRLAPILAGARVAGAGSDHRDAAFGDQIGALLWPISTPRPRLVKQVRSTLEQAAAGCPDPVVACAETILDYHDYWSPPEDTQHHAWECIERVLQDVHAHHPRRAVLLATHVFASAWAGRAPDAFSLPEVDPNCPFPEDLWVHGVAFLLSGQAREALELLRRAEARMPGHPFSAPMLIELAHAEALLGNLEEAHLCAWKAAACNPEYPRVFPCIAALCTALGRTHEARFALSRCRRDAPFEAVAHRHADANAVTESLYAQVAS